MFRKTYAKCYYTFNSLKQSFARTSISLAEEIKMQNKMRICVGKFKNRIDFQISCCRYFYLDILHSKDTKATMNSQPFVVSMPLRNLSSSQLNSYFLPSVGPRHHHR